MAVLIFAAVLVTATISGVFGMAGGLILMALYLALLSGHEAMILHGVTQLASNGSRTWLHRKHVHWKSVRYYFLGAAVSIGVFSVARVVLDKAWMSIALGSVPWLALCFRGVAFDFTRRSHAVLCGTVVTAAHLTAGVSGPLLDIFFLKTDMNRHAIVSTKAFTQSFAHILKIIYFGAWVSAGHTFGVSPWILFGVIPFAFLGSFLGKQLLTKLTDRTFLRWSQGLVLMIGTVCIVRGVAELLAR